MKNSLSKQEKESLDNKIVFTSSAIVLYAMLLAFIQQMSQSPTTVNGALAFIKILKWVALAGAMLFAAWSAYKEKKSVFTYCVTCLYIFISTTTLTLCTQYGSDRPYLINYAMLAVTFVLVQLYYYFKSKGLLNKKPMKIAFITVCSLAALAFAVVYIMHVNRVFFMK